MKKLITLLFIILSFSGFAQLLNPADTTGTLITASIRPNSQADDIATVYTNEARGTVHHYQTWAELLAMKPSRLVQYQLATVADSAGKVYQYNGTEWVDFVTSGAIDLSNYVDKISDETILGTKTFDSVTVFNNRVSQTGLGRSTFFGEDAGLNDDGSDNENVGIGYQSLYYNSTGYQNVVIGHYAGRYNITGRNNVYVGNKSGTFGEGDEDNVFVGNFTGYNSGITKSVLLGGYAGFTLQGEATEGTICIGYDAGHTAVSPLNSVFIGRGSGYYTSSDYSVYIGYYSGADTKYNDNVFIGNFAGRFYSDGVTKNEYSKESVLIGSNVRASTFDDVDNQIVIGSNAISNGSNTATIGDDNITDIYLSEDAGATVHAGKYLGSLAITDTDQLTTKSYVDNSTSSVISGLGYLRVPEMGAIGLQDSPILIDGLGKVILDNGISAPNLLVENIENDKDLTTKEYVDNKIDTSKVAFLDQKNSFTVSQEFQGNIDLIQSYLTRTSSDGYMKVFQPRGMPKFNTASYTGYLKITLPDLTDANILTLQIELSVDHSYSTDPSKKYLISAGYQGDWRYVSATVLADGSYDEGFDDVNFGVDANNFPCIWIGSPTTYWPMSAYTITEVTVGGVGYSSLVDNDWTVGFADALDTVEKYTDAEIYVRDKGLDISNLANYTLNDFEIDFSLNRGPVRNIIFSPDTITFSAVNLPIDASRVITYKMTHYDVDGDAIFIFPTEWAWTGTKPTGITGDQSIIFTLQNFGDQQTDIVASYVLIN